jgi:hypothetical protein
MEQTRQTLTGRDQLRSDPGESLALKAAANTGALIMPVRSIRRSESRVLFVGELPLAALDGSLEVSDGPIRVKAQDLGPFYPASAHTDLVGFLLLHRPVRLISGAVPDSEERVAVAVAGSPELLPPTIPSLGPVCCTRCNKPIPKRRLLAVPGATMCTSCQSEKEDQCRFRTIYQ